MLHKKTGKSKMTARIYYGIVAKYEEFGERFRVGGL